MIVNFKKRIKNQIPNKVIKKYNIIKKKSRKYVYYYGKPVANLDKSNELIGDLLQSKKPFMVSRIGAVELSCIVDYEFQNTVEKKFNGNIKENMSNNAGFFPSNNSNLSKFSEIFIDNLNDVDVLGIWYNEKEDYIARKYCKNSNFVRRASMEPYLHKNPWSQYLEGRKVLIIHPFSETIEMQYFEKRTKIFKDNKVLPEFDLKTFKSVQSIANNKTPYKSWFEALEYMCNEIEKVDFDVAIIGAGAYGLPLASFIKKIGKQSIHLGGATQILFGIKGSRWDNEPDIYQLYNDYWIRPLSIEMPENFKNVEQGCYW